MARRNKSPIPRTAPSGVAIDGLLSVEELAAMNGLVEAWNAWVKLESLHPDETTEFRRAIHTAQHIIMSRPVRREFNSDNA